MRNDEWIRRNNATVENIRWQAESGKYARIVILCGFEHRYYLLSNLPRDGKSYAVKEWDEY